MFYPSLFPFLFISSDLILGAAFSKDMPFLMEEWKTTFLCLSLLKTLYELGYLVRKYPDIHIYMEKSWVVYVTRIVTVLQKDWDPILIYMTLMSV